MPTGPGRFLALGVIVALSIVVAPATATKQGRNIVVSDPRDGAGKLYPPEVYAACDIRELKATVKGGGKLIVKVTTSGAQSFPNTSLNLNIEGSKKSDPEYRLGPDGALDDLGDAGISEPAAEVEQKDKKRALQFELPLRKIGSPKKTGLQAKTCGEGSVDIAPGGVYFDDSDFDGTVANRFAIIKTGH